MGLLWLNKISKNLPFVNNNAMQMFNSCISYFVSVAVLQMLVLIVFFNNLDDADIAMGDSWFHHTKGSWGENDGFYYSYVLSSLISVVGTV